MDVLKINEYAVSGYENIEFENYQLEVVIERCLPYVVGPSVLSLGYARDKWPEKLSEKGFQVHIVEGAEKHFEEGKAKFSEPNIKIFKSMFQDFEPNMLYDTVVAGSVIEFHDPLEFLSNCKRLLKPKGRLIVTTPNALSIHRRIGAAMGIEQSPLTVNVAGELSGTKKLFDIHSLRQTLNLGGFVVDLIFGANLKILSANQMKQWDKIIIDALGVVSQEFPPEFCKELVVICTAPDLATGIVWDCV